MASASLGAPAAANAPATLEQLTAKLNQVVGQLGQAVAALQGVGGVENLAPPPAAAQAAPVAAAAPAQPTAPPASASTPASNQPAPTSSQPAPASSQPPSTGGAASLRIASFNVLGDSHTGAGGNQHPTWQKGSQRTPRMIGYLTSGNVDVAGLQELQTSQKKEFAAANSGYSMYSPKGSQDAVVWKTSKFDKVATKTIPIKYYSGKTAKVPAVELRDKATGKTFWTISIHNPSEGYQHGTQPERTADMQIEKQAMQQLSAGGTPVYLVGDFNEKADATSAVTGGTQIKAAGGSTDKKEIDHIYGLGNLSFTGYSANKAPESTQTSDHPIVVATTTLT